MTAAQFLTVTPPAAGSDELELRLYAREGKQRIEGNGTIFQ